MESKSPNEAALCHFMAVLQGAQQHATVITKKRKRYNGNSQWTKWQQGKATESLHSQGYPKIQDLFRQQEQQKLVADHIETEQSSENNQRHVVCCHGSTGIEPNTATNVSKTPIVRLTEVCI
jgi:hypothetical protein